MANSPFRFFYTKTLDALKRRFSPTRERNHGTLAQWAILGVSSGYLLQQNRYAYGVKKVKYLNIGIVYLQKKQ